MPAMPCHTGSKVVEILNENNWETLITDAQKSGKAVIAEFTAVWCPPCRMIAPVLEDLARKHPQVDFVKLDIDNKAVENVVVSHGVAAVPTFVGYKGGNKVGAFSGADRAALTQMVERVKE
jgi:thioredoxin 1